MPTLYMDYEGGNNNYGGTSFALLASGNDGTISSTTFSSPAASFPNDGSLIGQYLSIFNGTIYAVYQITAWLSSTSLTLAAISGGTALANQGLQRVYYIGGRWKDTAGATAVRTIPGDTVRIMASPNPTSMGSATWTGGGRARTVNISSSTNATPIAITTSAAHGLVANDYVAVIAHTVNTNANGMWQVGSVLSSTQFTIIQLNGSNTTGNGVGAATGTAGKVNNCVVKTASALVQNITPCGGLGQKPAWTAVTNVVTAQNTATSWKEGYSSTSIAPSASFSTGKMAYYTLPVTLDLSSYQQVAFWAFQITGTIGAAGAIYLALCSDTLGDTVVHTCNVPALGALNTWSQVVVDFGTALSTTIRSVALYRTTNNGAQTFLIDNVIACKASSSADSVNLTSLISKSDGTGDEAWYGIESINGDAIVLGNANGNTVSVSATNPRGYSGTSETVTTYKRETIKTGATLVGTTVVFQALEAGTAGNPITYSGGWDRTNMSTQSGQSWFDGVNGNGVGWTNTTTSFLTLDRLNFCRYNTGLSISSTGSSIIVSSIYITAATSTGITLSSTSSPTPVLTNVWANNNGSTAISIGTSNLSITNIKSLANNGGTGVALASVANVNIGAIIAGNCGGAGGSVSFNSNVFRCTVGSLVCNGANPSLVPDVQVSNAFECRINGGSIGGGVSGVGAISAANSGSLYLNNVVISSATEVSNTTVTTCVVYSNRNDDTDNNSWQWQGLGTVDQQTTVVDSPATTSWRLRPTSANATAAIPIRLKLGTVVCAAGSLVTVTARMQRSNTGLTMRLICPGGQISGVASDVFSDMTAAANTWETVTITFTPTKAGGVDIWAYAFGGTTFSGYVCNLTASQV